MPFLRRRSPTPTHPQPRSAASALRRPHGSVASNRKRISTVADQQWGVASWSQLRRRGLAEATLDRAIRRGELEEVFRFVYSTIPPSLLSPEGWHAAAVLCGGEDARLCGASAGWWAGVLKERPAVIHVSARNDHEPVEGIQWHRFDLRGEEPAKVRRMPITPLARIPLELAPSLSEWELRGVLAELEFHHGIGPEEVRLHLGKGRAGGAKLRRALDVHTPQLAETKSELERAFALFIDECGFAQPAFNLDTGRATIDAVYADARIAIELDGVRGHSGERRILRDHRRDLHRRADGFLPLRYHFSQLKDVADRLLIEEELDRFGVPRSVASGPFEPR